MSQSSEKKETENLFSDFHDVLDTLIDAFFEADEREDALKKVKYTKFVREDFFKDCEEYVYAIEKAAGAENLDLFCNLENIFFPCWVVSIHKIRIKYGCPCSIGINEACFLNWSKEKQIAEYSNHPAYSFEILMDLWKAFQRRQLEEMDAYEMANA